MREDQETAPVVDRPGWARSGFDTEVGVLVQECRHLSHVLFVFQSTSSVNQEAASGNQSRRPCQYGPLELGQPGHVSRYYAPTGVRVPSQGAGSGAWGIDQSQIRHPNGRPAGIGNHGPHGSAEAICPLTDPVEPQARQIRSHHPPAFPAQGQRLPTGRGAQVGHGGPRTG